MNNINEVYKDIIMTNEEIDMFGWKVILSADVDIKERFESELRDLIERYKSDHKINMGNVIEIKR